MTGTFTAIVATTATSPARLGAPIQQVNEAYERMLASDEDRFSIDMKLAPDGSRGSAPRSSPD